jgi:glycosyltransferase involved in cell wall biosynthesis
VGYLGRVTEVKGVHLLMEGFMMVEDPRARLRVVGWEGAGDGYAGRLAALAARDARITLVPMTDQAGAIREYLGFDVMGIPSTWLETGPLTLFEGLAAGVRVLGSDRVGQIGLLRSRGRVVAPNTAEAWCRALVEEAGMKAKGREETGVALRTTRDVALEMLTLYGGSGEPAPEAGKDRFRRNGS